MADVGIRLAAVGDADAIVNILRFAFAEFESDYTPEAYAIVTPPADEVLGRFAEGPMWVAVMEGALVGTVSVVPEPDWLYIRSMAVLPAAQGNGIARRLLEVIESYGIENKFRSLFLYANRSAADAIRLYKMFGFVHVRETSADEWYGTPGVALEKTIGKDKN